MTIRKGTTVRKPFIVLAIAVFVLLVGTIGYMGIMRSSSEMAQTDSSPTSKPDAQNTSPPVDTTQDLDEALKTVDELTITEQLDELDELSDF